MHDRLLGLVAEALECHGYATTRQAALEGRSGTVYTVPLLAEGPLGAVILDVQADDPLPAAAVGDMADVLHDVGADAAILCHTGAVESGAQGDGVSLWGLDHLIHFIGEALVGRASDRPPQPLAIAPAPRPVAAPLAESVSDMMPPAFRDTPPSFDGMAMFDAPDGGVAQEPEVDPGALPFDLDALEQMAGLDDAAASAGSPTRLRADGHARRPEGPSHLPGAARAPVAGGAAGPSYEPAPVDPAPRYAHALLPVRVTPEEARLRARALLVADHVQMVLQPVHLIDYECDLLAEGSLRYDTVSGRIQVHGTDKTVTEVDAMAVDPQGFTRLPDAPRMPSHERTLRVSDERAAERATHHLLDAHTRLVEIEVDDPDLGYAYTEKKKVEPRPDHVRLNPLGVFHRVLWRLVGSAGHVDVDALTGDVVEEVLATPRHDTLVVD